ncbi:putative fibroblast growth factor 14-like [Scophthalmus maximus]|uniref:Putative fibroblast growth factor 14-like n=1 Tax=Scophthalmus maximus TaxID=52904 RepID=A0A2U9AVI2_SCOMX|nr:putative fibroblast growth factor 14-like [Scophthalmus maximus]
MSSKTVDNRDKARRESLWCFQSVQQKPTAAAYRRLHASAAACLSAAAAPLPAPRGRRRHLKRSARGVFTPRRPGGSSSDRSSAAEDHRPLGQPEDETAEESAAAAALFLPHGDDVDAEYVRLLVSGLVEKPGDEPGFLLLFLSMTQVWTQVWTQQPSARNLISAFNYGDLLTSELTPCDRGRFEDKFGGEANA